MRRFLTGWLVCALLCTLCACENAAGQADLQSIQKADVRELYEALYSDVAEAEETYVGKSYAFLGAVKSVSSGHGVIALKDFRDHVTYGNGIRAHFSKQTLGELRCDEMVWIAGTIAGFSCEDGTDPFRSCLLYRNPGVHGDRADQRVGAGSGGAGLTFCWSRLRSRSLERR